MIPTDVLRDHLPRQRWFAGTEPPERVEVVHHDVLIGGWPGLVRLIVEADGRAYQLVVGLRPFGERPDFLRGSDQAVLGEIDTEWGRGVAYDAIFDPELAMAMLRTLLPDASVERVRLMGVEQSNSSLIYDERFVLKLFRRLHPGPNPEVEVTAALAAQGFAWVAAPVASERHDDVDLAIVQPFLAGGVEGWALALTSVRDLFGIHDTQSVPVISAGMPPPAADPGLAGGDFAGEAVRLGETTADMHVAIAEAFGPEPGDARAWASAIEAEVEGAVDDPVAARAILDALRDSDPGPACRVHGDYHLGQVMRTDAGWYVLDFEGEPSRPIEERRRPSSPLRDVAGMLRSLHYASAVALLERDHGFDEVAAAWEARNRQAFLDGYLAQAAKGGILPADDASTEAVLAAFELEKAVYELDYERAHRPDWQHIPRAALDRLARR